MKTGTGATFGYTRYYVPYIYVGKDAGRTVVMNINVSSTATLGDYKVSYYSDWNTREGYLYTNAPETVPLKISS